jgi:hypothetical protein
MSSATEELLRVCEALPADKQAEVTDFARFLLERKADAAWERMLQQDKPRPRLEQFLRESAAEGQERLDPAKL